MLQAVMPADSPAPVWGRMLVHRSASIVCRSTNWSRIEVPDGTPDELLAFANQMGEKIMALSSDVEGIGQEATKARAIELFRAISLAADKVLATSNANQDQRKAAIENKAGAMIVAE